MTNIFLSGVGGQGIILASELLSYAALKSGYDVKKSEVHGMAQRGGSVISAVRFGKKVHSPLVTHGEADFLLSFEILEALRNINYLKPTGKLITSTQSIMPLGVSSGDDKLPRDINHRIEKATRSPIFIDAISLAKEAGNTRTANVVLLGALFPFIGLDEDIFIEVMKERIKPRFVDVNITAFNLGKEAVQTYV